MKPGAALGRSRASAGSAQVLALTAADPETADQRDQLGRFALQPDVQRIHRAGGDQDARTVVVMALRMTIDLFEKRREP